MNDIKHIGFIDLLKEAADEHTFGHETLAQPDVVVYTLSC